ELGKHLESAKAFVRKRGPHAVFIGRFTAALRVLVPGLSGMAELPYPTFLLYNVLGAVLWGTGFAILGYLAKNAWEQVATDARDAGLALLAVIVIGFVATKVIRRRREQRSAKTT
ncbi:MAG: DedA family protein, partial [Actinomycetota bacterium]